MQKIEKEDHMVTVTSKIDRRTYSILKALAKEDDRPISSLIRILFKLGLKSYAKIKTQEEATAKAIDPFRKGKEEGNPNG